MPRIIHVARVSAVFFALAQSPIIQDVSLLRIAACGNWNMCTNQLTRGSAHMRRSDSESNKSAEFSSFRCQVPKVTAPDSRFLDANSVTGHITSAAFLRAPRAQLTGCVHELLRYADIEEGV